MSTYRVKTLGFFQSSVYGSMYVIYIYTCGDEKVFESYKIVSESKFLNPTLFRVGVIMEVVSYIC